jgi:hypothetical protein
MRPLHSESHFCHALYALQDADGYVDALMGMAREQVLGRKSGRSKAFRRGSSPARSRNSSVPSAVFTH